MQNTFTINSPKKIWSPRIIGWITLLCGVATGLIVASINWARMGYRLKAALHGLLGVGAAFLYAYSLRNYIGLSSRETVGLSLAEYALRLFLNFGLTFLVIAYLHLTTQKDIQHLQVVESHPEKANVFLAISIAVVTLIGSTLLTNFTASSQLAAFQNHVYCELLTLGMTASEVDNALLAVGPHRQLGFGTESPKTEVNDFDYFRAVSFADSAVESKYDLGLGLGYDKNNQLVWVSKYTGPDGFKTIDCP
jgi:hypothetical protein